MIYEYMNEVCPRTKYLMSLRRRLSWGILLWNNESPENEIQVLVRKANEWILDIRMLNPSKIVVRVDHPAKKLLTPRPDQANSIRGWTMKETNRQNKDFKLKFDVHIELDMGMDQREQQWTEA